MCGSRSWLLLSRVAESVVFVANDLALLTSWHDSWSDLDVVIFGLGKTGFSAADTLAELGARVTVVTDSADDLHLSMCDVLGIDVVLSSPESPVPDRISAGTFDVGVVSPGYPPTHPLITWAGERGIPLWTDVDLAWRLRDKVGPPAQWILVTGTNGKTTTTQLVSHMLAHAGFRVAPCGNIGVPVLDAIRHPEGFDFFVVELSSYQLHYMGPIWPQSAVCLNLAEDHLDWHGSLEAYALAKAKVYANVSVACVYNKSDEATLRMVELAEVVEGARAIGFDLGVPGMSDLGVVEGVLCDRAFLDDRHERAIELTTVEELAERGLDSPHMVSNVLAASALARAAGVSAEDISDALALFTVDAHRHQVVARYDDVTWIDDSKATNPHAAEAALRAHQSIIWILGGLLKGVEVDGLISGYASRLKAAVVIGSERQVILDAFARHAPEVPVFEVLATETSDVMPRAVEIASQLAVAHDVILLAPAAASMDQFTDYAHRGDLFVKAVKAQIGGVDE